ncbi:MAG TPA: hypothetical protein VHI13_05475 [Candidatus Kapabacteria bacterium]|nr:hypothetical protein [Candidatus Kapabacteria bacterium]
MNTFMTIDEVFAHHPDEWILLDELKTEDNRSVLGGVVVGHDPVRSVVEELAIAMRLERCAMVCTRKRDGEYVVSRDYAVSPITSFTEMEAVRGGKE